MGQGAGYLELVLSGLSLRSWVEKINGENLSGWNTIVSNSLWMSFAKIAVR
jgi:hypothetical protein